MRRESGENVKGYRWEAPFIGKITNYLLDSSHRPQLSDLRDSGSIEQDADCVLFLYRDSYYASQNPDGAEVDADTAECIVAKNRHGETSTVPLGWDGAHTRFMDVDFKR